MKRLLALSISLAVMAVIFIKIDRSAFVQHLAELDFFWLSIAFLFFIPQIGLTAWRWKWMIRHDRVSTYGESLRLILATSSLNVFLPSKLGDLCKAYYLAQSEQLNWKRGLNQVLFERFLDLWALCWMGTFGVLAVGLGGSIGWLIISLTVFLSAVLWIIFKLPMRNLKISILPSKFSEKIESFLADAHDYVDRLKANPAELLILFASSMILWALHVAQFYFAGLAIESVLSLGQIFCSIPIGILIGLLPFTLAGIGTRDAALIYLLLPFETSSKIIFLGLFATARYLVPGLAGIPFIHLFFTPQLKANLKQVE